MSALVYAAPVWHRARARRAVAGKAPRLAISRTIVLRESASGGWSVSIYTQRFGVWGKPERLCDVLPFDTARSVAVEAWRRLRLPMARVFRSDGKLRPFRLDAADMKGVQA